MYSQVKDKSIHSHGGMEFLLGYISQQHWVQKVCSRLIFSYREVKGTLLFQGNPTRMENDDSVSFSDSHEV